jgi:diguanylate cyclase (GGDEF)-like protein
MKWTLNKQLFVPLVAIFVTLMVGGTIVGLKLAHANARANVEDRLGSTSAAIKLLLEQQERDQRGITRSLADVVEAHAPVGQPETLPVDRYFAPAMTANDIDSIQLMSASAVPLIGVGSLPSLGALDLKLAGRAKVLSTITGSGESLWLLGIAPLQDGTGAPIKFIVTGKLLDQSFLDSLAREVDTGLILTLNDVSVRSSLADIYVEEDPSALASDLEKAKVAADYGVLTTELARGTTGSVQMSVLMSTDDIMGRVQAAAIKIIGIMLAGGLCAMVAVFFAARSVSSPIKRLALRAQSISEGNYGETVAEKGVEEIRTLKRSFNQMSLALQESYERLSRLANTDGLTGLYNHRFIQEILTQEIERAREQRQPIAVILADIDNFKLFNATHGHAAGDKVLRLVAEIIQGTTRNGEIASRFGGDKFMVVAPGMNRRRGEATAERIRKRLSGQGVRMERGQRLPLRISMGVAVYPQDSTNKEELLAYADASLFESKRAGGDKVTLANSIYQATTLGVLDGLVQVVDKKDRYTKSHSEENAEYAMMLGQALGLSENTQSALRIAGLLHDIGKIGIPDGILKKPGPLTTEERHVVQQHVVLSGLIIQGVPHAEDVADAVVNHHERWDGNGYPRGLKGEAIPLLGRIMAVVDAYSAITSDRPFRKGQSHRIAVAELRKNAGTQFDPQLVEMFIGVLESQQKEAAA